MTNLYLQKIDPSGNIISVYSINNNQSFQPEYEAPVSPMPLPQNDDTQNILIKIEGNSTQITESWIMKTQQNNNATPLSSNTGFVCVSTLDLSAVPLSAFDQVIWFKKFMLPKLITDRYRLTVADGITLGATSTVSGQLVYAAYSFTNFFYEELGIITSLKPIMAGDSPVSFTTTLTFQVGNVVSAYELNVPTAAQNFTATPNSGGTHRIDLAWTVPQDTAGGLTKYNVYRRTWNTSQVLVTTISSPGVGAQSYADSATTTGITYYYIVVAYNAQGQGISTQEQIATSP